MDTHSFARPEQVRVRHLELDLEVDFDARALRGAVTLRFDPAQHEDLILDTRGQRIHGVEHAGGAAAFTLGELDPVLGASLRIAVPRGATWVRVSYETAPAASALQWCEPAQTAGKVHPFLYTQSQAIHARSWIPLQDSPGVRVTYDARIRTRPGLLAVMGAEMEQDPARTGDYRFHMPQAIPPYLIALCVGDLAFRPLGPRSGVYAELPVVDGAAFEFAGTEAMIGAVEEMYGEYRWGRYDLLVLPPSFPYGGMENPRLTFVTPTILAGDRSLVSIIAHELAHSWSGNLVTNATWSDFWLNEGFTVYLERRIVAKVFGGAREQMEAALASGQLTNEMTAMEARDRVLHVDLAGRDPDAGCTLVPYEKGSLFLREIEKAVGRARWDAFLVEYFKHFAFQSITTADFLAYLRRELPEAAAVPVDEWVFGEAIPAPAVWPQALAWVEAAGRRWLAGGPIDTAGWTTHEWLHFLHTIGPSAPMERLDAEFGFTAAANAEVLHQWLLLAVRRDYAAAFPRLASFLCEVGRRKFVRPLFSELVKTPAGRTRAERIYAVARPGYHPITQATVDAILAAGDPRGPVPSGLPGQGNISR
jgi:leukotriene-A4 hydrolase